MIPGQFIGVSFSGVLGEDTLVAQKYLSEHSFPFWSKQNRTSIQLESCVEELLPPEKGTYYKININFMLNAEELTRFFPQIRIKT